MIRHSAVSTKSRVRLSRAQREEWIDPTTYRDEGRRCARLLRTEVVSRSVSQLMVPCHLVKMSLLKNPANELLEEAMRRLHRAVLLAAACCMTTSGIRPSPEVSAFQVAFPCLHVAKSACNGGGAHPFSPSPVGVRLSSFGRAVRRRCREKVRCKGADSVGSRPPKRLGSVRGAALLVSPCGP